MKAAISFRSKEDTLNDTEFNQFLLKLFETIPKRELITKSLYYLICNECHFNKNIYTETIHETMKNIIDLREAGNESNDDIIVHPQI